MEENNMLEKLNNGINELNEDGRQYVLAISQALVFAQNLIEKSDLDSEKIVQSEAV